MSEDITYITPEGLVQIVDAIQSFDYFTLLLLPKFNEQIGRDEQVIALDQQTGGAGIAGGVGKLTIY